MACDHCTDPDGAPCYPQHGLAPHRHEWDELRRRWSTVFLAQVEWPQNFSPDPGDKSHGTWWCEACGDGKPTAV